MYKFLTFLFLTINCFSFDLSDNKILSNYEPIKIAIDSILTNKNKESISDKTIVLFPKKLNNGDIGVIYHYTLNHSFKLGTPMILMSDIPDPQSLYVDTLLKDKCFSTLSRNIAIQTHKLFSIQLFNIRDNDGFKPLSIIPFIIKMEKDKLIFYTVNLNPKPLANSLLKGKTELMFTLSNTIIPCDKNVKYNFVFANDFRVCSYDNQYIEI